MPKKINYRRCGILKSKMDVELKIERMKLACKRIQNREERSANKNIKRNL